MSNQQPKIPDGWKMVKIGEVGKVSMCKRIFKKETQSSGPIPFYKISTFGNNADAYISEELFNLYKNKYPYPKKGDILISASGTIGRTVVFDGAKAYFQDSNIVWIANPEDKVLNKYLKSVYKKTKWTSTDGGVISRLYNDNLRSIKFLLPPLPEQHRIVQVLETWDKYLSLLDKKIKRKKKIKRGLMQNLLTGKVRGDKFNQAWIEHKLGDLGSTYSGLVNKNKDDFGRGEPFISYMNIYSNSAINTKINDLVSIREDEKQSKVKYGDLFFTTSSETPDEVGISSVLLDKITKNLYLNSFCFGFRLSDFNKLLPIFSKYYFRGQEFRKEMFRLAQGATRFNLSKKYFLNVKIKIPGDLEEQKYIANLLNETDREIETLKKQHQLIAEQKKFLLNNLITGQMRLPEFVKN